jgi:hypothetical protein
MRTRKRVFSSLQILMLPLLFSGCGVAAISAIAATSGGSSSGAGVRPNTAPSIAIVDASVPAEVTGNLVLAFVVTDGEGDTVSVKTQISSDNGASFRDVPNSAIVSGSNIGLGGSADGVQFSFTINLSDPALFPGQTVSQAVVRLQATDGPGLVSDTDDSNAFRIANNNPPVLTLVTNNDDVKEVALTFNVSDSEAVLNTVAFPATTQTLMTGVAGELALSSFSALTTSFATGTPGTILIRYDNGSVLVDKNNSDGTGTIEVLSGPGFTNGTTAIIDYATGVITGDRTITVVGNTTASTTVSADYNRSYLVIRKVQYDDLRNAAGLQTCTASNGNQKVPFPVFVTRALTAQTFVWDSLTDLDFGNSQFVQLRLELDDGENTVNATGNNFLISNGPLGGNTQIPALGQSDELRMADLDNDGLIDAIIVHSAAPNSSFSVFYNNGQGFDNPFLQVLPIPTIMGAPAFNSVGFGSRPTGGLDPNHLALIDINRDNIKDLVMTNGADTSPEPQGQAVSSQFIVYFGTGNRAQPFNLTNFWGPLRTGGVGASRLLVGDANNDAVDDLIILNRFSHTPQTTSSRDPFLEATARSNQPLNSQGAATAPYDLAANGQLANSGVVPGTVQIAFLDPVTMTPVGGLGDKALLGSTLGVIADAGQNPVAYILYPTGQFILDPRALGIPAPLGPLPGTTLASPVLANALTIANYTTGAPITAATLIKDATFIKNQPAGATSFKITIQGFGHRGLSNTQKDRAGMDLTEMVDVNGITVPLASVKVNKSAALFPIFDDTFDFTETTTFGDLTARIATLYLAERVAPLVENIDVVIESGFIRVKLVKTVAGANTQLNPAPQLVLPAEIQLSDNATDAGMNPDPNPWPLFEDSHGRIAIYHVHPNGGFRSPNLTQAIPSLNPAQSFFPVAIPNPLNPANNPLPVPATAAARYRMIPNGFNPDANTGNLLIDKMVSGAGLGEAETLYNLVDILGGVVVYPPAYSSAAADNAAISNPVTAPAHLGAATPLPPAATATYTGGFLPRDCAIGSVIPISPTDTLNDLIVSCPGDGIFISMPKIPTIDILGPTPDPSNPLILYFAMFDYIDGLFATQELDVVGLLNSNIIRANPSTGAGFFISPEGTELRAIRLKLINDDPLLDIVASGGNFLIVGLNAFGQTPIPNPPFSVQIAVPGLLPGVPDVGDVNNDAKQDILLPVGASKEVVTLIQTPTLTSTLAVSNNSLVLDGTTLTDGTSAGFNDTTRTKLSSTSIRIPFTSSGVAMELRSVTTVMGTRFQLFQNGVRVATSAAFGSIDGNTGVITGTLSGVTVDESSVTISYGQLFQKNFLQNEALENMKLIKFPSGFIPIQTFAIDVNQDGLVDAVTLDGQSNNLSFRLQSPSVAFDNFINVSTGITPFLMEAGDVIKDNGVTEILVANIGSNTIGIYVPDAVKGLSLVQEVPLTVAAGLPVPLIPFGIKLRDFDKDGVLDAFVSVSAVGGASAISILNQPEAFGGGWIIIPGLTKAEMDAGANFSAAVVGLAYTNTLGSDTADINNDGLLDVFVCNNGGGFTNGGISFYINQGVPNLSDPNNEILTTFANFGNVPNPGFNASQAVSPINLKILPISVPLETPTSIFNNANSLIGNFLNPGTRNYFTNQFSPTQAQIADLNGDGFTDLIVSVGTPRANGFPSIALYKGKDLADISANSGGQPFFLDPANTNANIISYIPSYINIQTISPSASVDSFPADFNEDGRVDLVVGDLTTAAAAGIMFNRIDQANPPAGTTFTNADFFNVKLSAVGQPSGFSIGDVNGDGKMDILLADQQRGLVSIYINQLTEANKLTFDVNTAAGQAKLANLFSKPILIQAGPTVLDVLVIDLNGDGKQDLLASSSGSNTINVFFAR